MKANLKGSESMKSKSLRVFSIVFYVLAAIFLLVVFFSGYVCHLSIASQLRQGATVAGNEIPILNIYFSGCAQYVGLSALLFFAGLATGRWAVNDAVWDELEEEEIVVEEPVSEPQEAAPEQEASEQTEQ